MHTQDSVPEANYEAVACALREAFGTSEVDDIGKMTAGLSKALVFRIVVRGCPYLLRITPDTKATAGPGQGDHSPPSFAVMKSAAEAGNAPRVTYASTAEGITNTDNVDARPLQPTTALAFIPATLRDQHSLPPFPSPRAINYFTARIWTGFDQRFRSMGVVPESETAELFELYAHLRDVYPRDGSEMVPCHNDLKPENIIFDGERVWLVDWEAAFLNDRYIDLSVVANFVVTNDAEEEAYLQSYFGEATGEYRHARFYLASQLLHVFYVVLVMVLVSKGKPVQWNTEAPDFRDFHERIRGG